MIHIPRRLWRYLSARLRQHGQWSVLLFRYDDNPLGPVAYELTVEGRPQVVAAVAMVKQHAALDMIP